MTKQNTFNHALEKDKLSKDDYYHKDAYICSKTDTVYCLKHLHSFTKVFDDEKYNKQYNCKIVYRTHTYTKGAKHSEIDGSIYDRSKVINIELDRNHYGTKFDEYRFFSESRYKLSLELNNLLDRLYNNQVRLNEESHKSNEYTAFPYLKEAKNPNKNYCIFITIYKSKSTKKINIVINSAFIETRDHKVKARTKTSVQKKNLMNILRSL